MSMCSPPEWVVPFFWSHKLQMATSWSWGHSQLLEGFADVWTAWHFSSQYWNVCRFPRDHASILVGFHAPSMLHIILAIKKWSKFCSVQRGLLISKCIRLVVENLIKGCSCLSLTPFVFSLNCFKAILLKKKKDPTYSLMFNCAFCLSYWHQLLASARPRFFLHLLQCQAYHLSLINRLKKTESSEQTSLMDPNCDQFEVLSPWT